MCSSVPLLGPPRLPRLWLWSEDHPSLPGPHLGPSWEQEVTSALSEAAWGLLVRAVGPSWLVLTERETADYKRTPSE